MQSRVCPTRPEGTLVKKGEPPRMDVSKSRAGGRRNRSMSSPRENCAVGSTSEARPAQPVAVGSIPARRIQQQGVRGSQTDSSRRVGSLRRPGDNNQRLASHLGLDTRHVLSAKNRGRICGAGPDPPVMRRHREVNSPVGGVNSPVGGANSPVRGVQCVRDDVLEAMCKERSTCRARTLEPVAIRICLTNRRDATA
eukprot:1187418-Prorocentrum_minimum.AAC.1